MKARFSVGLTIQRLLVQKDRSFSVVIASRDAHTGENFTVAMHPSDDPGNHFYDHIVFPVRTPELKKPLYSTQYGRRDSLSFLSSQSSPSSSDSSSVTAHLTYQAKQWLQFPGLNDKLVLDKPVTELVLTPAEDQAIKQHDLEYVCFVFVETLSNSGAVVFELFAQGSVKASALCAGGDDHKTPTRVELFDVEKQSQGFVELTCAEQQHRATAKLKPIPSKDDQEYIQGLAEQQIDTLRSRWILTLQGFHKRQGKDGKLSDSQLNSVIFADFEQTSGGHRLPVWAFVALTRKLREVSPSGELSDPAKSIKVLKHWAAVASHLQSKQRVSPRHWDKQTKVELDANLLSEFLTLPFRAMIYSPDEVERKSDGSSSSTKRFMTDQWVQISNFPASPFICYDCEDGTLLVIQVFWWLKAFIKQWKSASDNDKLNWTSSDPEIHALAAIASTSDLYVPFFCLGELQTSVDKRNKAQYSPHAFCVLVPRSTMRKHYKDSGHAFDDGTGGLDHSMEVHFGPRVRDEEIPSILVESTSYTDGAYTQAAMEDSVSLEQFREAYEPFVHEKHSPSSLNRVHYRRCMKPKAPVLALRAHGIYRKIFCAITPMASKYTKNVRHEVFVFPYGTATDDFLMRREGVVMRSILKSTKEDEKGVLKRWLSMYPYGSLSEKAPRRTKTLQELGEAALAKKMKPGGMAYTGRFEELKYLGEVLGERDHNPTAMDVRKTLVGVTHKNFRSMPIEILRDLRTVVVAEEEQSSTE